MLLLRSDSLLRLYDFFCKTKYAQPNTTCESASELVPRWGLRQKNSNNYNPGKMLQFIFLWHFLFLHSTKQKQMSLHKKSSGADIYFLV